MIDIKDLIKHYMVRKDIKINLILIYIHNQI
jgi:hypothetical protein